MGYKHIQIKKKLVMTKNAEKSIKGKKHNRNSVPKNSEKSIKGKSIADTQSIRSTHNT